MNNDLFKKIAKQEREALAFGFYWENIDQLIDQICSECAEIRESWEKGDSVHLQEEIGDLLHAAVCLAIFCKMDPHETLKKNIDKFQKRYDRVVALVKQEGREHLLGESLEILMHYWNRAKKSP